MPENTRPEFKLGITQIQTQQTDKNGSTILMAFGQVSLCLVNQTQVILHVYMDPTKFKVVQGRSFTEDRFMSFRWDHYADLDKRIDPSTSNIVDVYVLTSDYVRKVNKWIAGGLKQLYLLLLTTMN